MRLVLMGPPGAGKGSLADELKETFAICHISTGEIFRQKKQDGSDLGKKIKSLIDNGNLVPDELVDAVVIEQLQKTDMGKGFILDGFPRNREQAVVLDAMLKSIHLKLDAAIDMNAESDLVLSRLTGRRVCEDCKAIYHIANHPPKKENRCDLCNGTLIQRKDDEEKTILNRLKIYQETVDPLKEYYKSRKVLFSVDGALESDVICKEIKVALDAKNKK